MARAGYGRGWSGNSMKEETKTLAMTRKFLTEFYDFGNVIHIMAQMDASVVAFGTQSLSYAVGKEAVHAWLLQEHAFIAPCKIARISLQEREMPDGLSVMADVILRAARDVSVILHRWIFMYRRQDRDVRLAGLHVVRDIHHESTYRMISSRMLNDAVQTENKLDSMRSMDVVASYTDCAYVVSSLGQERRLSSYSDEFWRMLGYTSAADLQANADGRMLALIPGEDHKKIQNLLTRQLLRKDVYQMEYRMRCKDGHLIWVIECGRREMGIDARPVFHSVILNITPLKKTRENLIYQVSYDDLTGLYNKTAFYQKAQELLSNYPDKKFEIMRMDIERFKVINDLFGEETGDQILQYIARFFVHAPAKLCIYGRLHSDHFLLCYPAENDNRMRFIKSLQTMAASFTLDYHIVLRFGVYRVQNRSLSVSVMCDRAGLALAKAKHNGLMACGEYDEDMRRHIVNEQAIVNEMGEALSRGEFVIYLQPKYELITEKIVGAEALVRWMHPTRGCISPADFVPVFEHNGFIFKLDQYVWEESCRLLRRWLDAGRQPLPISVNVSRIDLYSTNFVAVLVTLVKKYDLPAALLELELTESAYTDNPLQIIEVTKNLQAMGFKILMDDFGSGYSSLNMLKDMPVDVLKIDLKFLDSHDESGRGGNILNSVVRMAKWLRIPVIAEGVETRQQVEFLRTIGCNQAQGYYYSRPVPVPDYEVMVAQNQYESSSAHLSWLDDKDTEDLLNPNTQVNLLFNSINGAIGLYELKGNDLELLRANDGYFDMFQEEQVNFYTESQQVLSHVYEEDREILLHTMHAARDRGKVMQCSVRRRLANGGYIWLHVRVSVIASEGDRQLLYLAMEDITPLQTKTMEMQALLDNIPGGFGLYEVQGNVIRTHYLSKWLYDLNGLTAANYMKRTGGDLGKLLVTETRDLLIREIARAAEERQTLTVEYPFQTPDGRNVWLKAMFNAVQRESGSYYCYAFIRDCTKQHREQ